MNVSYTKNQTYYNDPEGFITPYKLCGKVDKEVMQARYYKLVKSSRGCFVRCGIASKAGI